MNTNPPPQHKTYKLTTKNLFNHFLLVHDFLHKFTKINALNPQFLDTQIDVTTIMTNATSWGGRVGQIGALAATIIYCLKSHSIPRKFLAGFLYVYWLNHAHTLGTYLGALIKMPTAYSRVGQYYQKSSTQSHPNLLDKLQTAMDGQDEYEDPQSVLKNIFPESAQPSSNTYITNQFFVKNRDKYMPKEYSENPNSLKLPYLDSFLTRYVYYSFTRWVHRVKLFLGVTPQ